MTTPWEAGAARVPFPIPAGTPLAGYAARTGPATGTLDDLQIAALVLDHGDSELVLVTVDLVGIDAGLVVEVAIAAGIDPDSLLLAASHTHSGPAGIVSRLHPATGEAVNAELRARFVASCGEAIREATSRRQPATLWLGQAIAPGVGANRNAIDGPSDGRVTTLSVRSDQNEQHPTLVTLVHFACHPTILGAESRFVSADLPGGIRRATSPSPPAGQGQGGPGGVGGRSAPDSVILYANGAAGDISTRFTRLDQTDAEVQRLGSLLAEGASLAASSAAPLYGPLRRASLDIPLPRKPDPGPDAPKIASRLRAEAERVLASDAPPAAKRQAFTRAQGAGLAATMAGATGIPETARITAWSLGGLAIVAIPAELFASLGRQIEQGSPFPTTLIAGYANGHVGYLVDRDAEASGTYEALASPYTLEAGESIVNGAIRILRELHDG